MELYVGVVIIERSVQYVSVMADGILTRIEAGWGPFDLRQHY